MAAAHDYNWSEAAREFQLAMASPSVPAEAHWAYASLFLSTFGRFEESTAEMRRAVEKDPLSVDWRGVLMGSPGVCREVRGGARGGTEGAGDRARTKFTRIWPSARPIWRWGESTKPSPPRRERIVTSRSIPWAPDSSRLCWFGLEKRIGLTALLREMGDSPTPIWGRAWYHLLCSEVDAAAHGTRR